jgi:hypothetical protein
MSAQDSFWAHWYFHVPNLLMAAMIYTLIARYLLELIFAKQPDAVMLKVFRSVTDWLLRIVRGVTPGIVPNGLVVVFTAFWLMALRLAWYLVCTLVFGMRIKLGG